MSIESEGISLALEEDKSPQIRAREIAAVSLVAALLAIVMTWPLTPNLSTHFMEIGVGDPFLLSWGVAWEGHALTENPTGMFQANAYWPEEDSFAFTDVMLGYAPVGAIGSGPTATAVRHNLLILFTYTLAFVGAYLLARELGPRPGAAVVAGAAFAYAFWRIDQSGHLNILSSGGIPLALFLLLRGYRNGWARMVFAGWVVATWQFSLGFSLGIQFAYLLAILGVIAAIRWAITRTPTLTRGLVAATVAGALVFGIWAAIQSRPFLRVASEHPESERTEAEVAFYSPPPRGLLTAPAASKVWGERTEEQRSKLSWPSEQSLFPGVVVPALAAGGLVGGRYSRRLRFGLAAVIIITVPLSLGLSFSAGDALYGTLFRHFPGFEGIRTPGRLFNLTSVALALLAAGGAHELLYKDRSGGRMVRVASIAVSTLMVAAVMIEGAWNVTLTPIPEVPAASVAAPEPQLHLPSDEITDRLHMFWSTAEWPRIVNGAGSFVPALQGQMRGVMANFPDPVSVAYLEDLGVRTVVLHTDLTLGTAWETTAAKPIAGLPLTREVAGNVVLYRLEGG